MSATAYRRAALDALEVSSHAHQGAATYALHAVTNALLAIEAHLAADARRRRNDDDAEEAAMRLYTERPAE